MEHVIYAPLSFYRREIFGSYYSNQEIVLKTKGEQNGR